MTHMILKFLSFITHVMLLDISYGRVFDVIVIENQAEVVLGGRVILNGVTIVESFGCDHSCARVVILDAPLTKVGRVGLVVVIEALSQRCHSGVQLFFVSEQ